MARVSPRHNSDRVWLRINTLAIESQMLLGASAVAVSPDGANVYVAGGTPGNTPAQSFGNLAILSLEGKGPMALRPTFTDGLPLSWSPVVLAALRSFLKPQKNKANGSQGWGGEGKRGWVTPTTPSFDTIM